MGESDNMSSSSSCSSSSSASSSYSNVSMEQVTTATSSSNELNDDDNNNNNAADVPDECAYWIQRTVREAIYGRVLLAVVLKKRRPATMPTPTITTSTTTATSTITTAATTTGGGTINADWEVTAQHCAVKEMSWQHIRRERDRLAEDPVKEVSAMQFLKEWHAAAHFQRQQQQPLNYKNNNSTNTTDRSRIHSSRGEDSVTSSFRSMLETNVMMPLDLLSDEGHLYSIMPYCNGGELFELLDMNERFTEPEARYWMNQVLNVRTLFCTNQQKGFARTRTRRTPEFFLFVLSFTRHLLFLRTTNLPHSLLTNKQTHKQTKIPLSKKMFHVIF